MSFISQGDGAHSFFLDSIVERISLRRVSPLTGFCDVRLPDVHLRGLWVEECAGGRLSVSAPMIPCGYGRTMPAYAVQPGAREAIEAAVAKAWRATEARR